MTRDELDARFRILSLIARADGSVDDDEEALLRRASDADAPERIDLDAELARLRSADAKRATYEAALAIATIDGKCTSEEHALLARLQGALGVHDPLVTAETRWIERLREPRRRLAKATDEFLHAIRGELSQEAYEGLVAELRDRRAAILESVLPG